MKRKLISRVMTAAFAAVLVLLAAGTASAQQRYATGGEPTPQALRQSAPEVPIFRDFLPEAVDLSRYFPPVGDQMQQGSCVGWATAYAARAYYALVVEGRDTQQADNIPSPAWVFNLISLSPECDQGSYIYDALTVLKGGAQSLADYPYDDTKCAPPSTPTRIRSTDFRIEDFNLVFSRTQEQPQGPLTDVDVDQTKAAIAQGHPVMIIALLDNSFFYMTNQPGHQIWQSDADDANEGGHAFTLVGYDDAKGVFKFINSWNTSWGTDGYGYMTYDTFKARLVEGWTIVMPGNPEITLDPSVYQGAPIDDAPPPPPPVIYKPILVTPMAAARGLGDEEIDFGDLSCGAVELGLDAEGNKVATGFVSTADDLAKVNGLLGDTESQVVLAPWPKCEVLETLGPQLADSDTPQALVDPEAPKVGDNVAIGIQTPGFDSYLYAAYFSADGSVLNLAQPNSNALKPLSGHSTLTFGTGEPGQSGLTVSPPVGDELLLVVASETPLFDVARPDMETDRQFLSGLREAVLSGDAGRITATLVPVTTTE